MILVSTRLVRDAWANPWRIIQYEGSSILQFAHPLWSSPFCSFFACYCLPHRMRSGRVVAIMHPRQVSGKFSGLQIPDLSPVQVHVIIFNCADTVCSMPGSLLNGLIRHIKKAVVSPVWQCCISLKSLPLRSIYFYGGSARNGFRGPAS